MTDSKTLQVENASVEWDEREAFRQCFGEYPEKMRSGLWKGWKARAAANVQPKGTQLPEALGEWLTAIGELYIAMGRPKFEATEPTLGVVETLREAAKRLAAQAPAPAPKKMLFDAVERALELSSLHAGSVAMSDRDGATAYRRMLREHLVEYMYPAPAAQAPAVAPQAQAAAKRQPLTREQMQEFARDMKQGGTGGQS